MVDRRRTGVATILFLDIVGSTRIASDLGDVRWRAVLDAFRRIVRADLRTHHGHEQDTAGDAFFATFGSPLSALRCAASVVARVQTVGLDIRCGIHAGEVGGVEDGRPGGMAVHVAARVMALAGPAEVLCTRTVRDLTLGSPIVFLDRGAEVLKDVPGRWDLFGVWGVQEQLPPPLTPNEASRRLSVVPVGRQKHRHRTIIGVVSAVLATVVAAAPLSLAGRPHSVGPRPPALLRIDPSTNRVVDTVGVAGRSINTVLSTADGVLWQQAGDSLITRQISDGSDPHRVAVGPAALRYVPTFGFGAAWTIQQQSLGTPNGRLIVTRWDAASGRRHRVATDPR